MSYDAWRTRERDDRDDAPDPREEDERIDEIRAFEEPDLSALFRANDRLLTHLRDRDKDEDESGPCPF